MKKIYDTAGLVAEAAAFAQALAPVGTEATVVALSGELGAGKTTFAQAMASALGVRESVTSPTFVLEKIYPLEERAFARLVHIDAYRLQSPDALKALGWGELLQDPSNLIVIEWPENVAHAIPPSAIHVRFDIVDGGRIITSDGERKDT